MSEEFRHIAVLWSFSQDELKQIEDKVGKPITNEELVSLVENILDRYGNMEYYELENL